MTTAIKTTTATRADSNLASIVAVFVIGATLLFSAGLAQATALHDAAHDTRHAMAFPCH
ncbi:MAG: CbtB-domain containing protein [Alphaproteobacteria bacterium]|nr:MAG: CbtB-domain containing protein [Alphaproteobacteria bacterium]